MFIDRSLLFSMLPYNNGITNSEDFQLDGHIGSKEVLYVFLLKELNQINKDSSYAL